MALIPKDEYPLQTSTADPAGYPYGAAKNQATFGDGTGTPWEAKVPNDVWGFLQGLLVAAGITPSGLPDKANASQYLQAIQALITTASDALSTRITALENTARRPGFFEQAAFGVFLSHGNFMSFAEVYDPASDYGLEDSGRKVSFERNGYYWITPTAGFREVDVVSVPTLGVDIDGTVVAQILATTVAGAPPHGDGAILPGVSGRVLVRITDFENQRLGVRVLLGSGGSVQVSRAYLAIEPGRI
jgi:hypothetical protein